jgi:uncharacterized cupin superfamily protein/uncharacterized protein YbcV (DUF1398 family)
MATILKSNQREFREDPNKIDHFRLFSDLSRKKRGLIPQQLNFDLRLLNPGQFSAPYHFHRYAEELFMVLSGSMTLRTPDGLEIVSAGDLIFFEMGETGAHQFFNHGTEPSTYLDVRSFIGYDVCEYPDSGKILLAPSFEIFRTEAKPGYFEGEEHIREKWKQLKNKGIMFTVEQIEQAHDKVKSGADFPKYIREIKEMGVTAFETWVSDSHTVYIGKDDFRTTSQPKYAKLTIEEISNKEKFCLYLKIHQQGETDYFQFCKHCAETGIEKWFVSLEAMTCIYYDKAGNEILVEGIPQ